MQFLIKNVKVNQMGEYISGKATKGNLKSWANYSKGNSYHADKAQLRRDVSSVGAAKDAKGDWSKDWQQPQKSQERQGWAPMDAVKKRNTFTGS
jgi:hypothetical protein